MNVSIGIVGISFEHVLSITDFSETIRYYHVLPCFSLGLSLPSALAFWVGVKGVHSVWFFGDHGFGVEG